VGITTAGCIAMGSSYDELTTIGRPLDPLPLSSIKPGATTFSEVLDLLGPPDFIVAGQQRLMDEESFFATFRGSPNIRNRPISTRQIKAPPGSVILIYSYIESKRNQDTFSVLLLPSPATFGFDELNQYIVRENKTRANEAFIYLSITDQKVISVAVGPP
jgi:hypothetical protein